MVAIFGHCADRFGCPTLDYLLAMDKWEILIMLSPE